MPWLFKDEASPASDAMFAVVKRGGALVPSIWMTEITNALGMAERRNRVAPSDMPAALSVIDALAVTTDTPPSTAGAHRLLHLMRTHRLTAYDATYLELAIRRGLPLASNDRDLRKAASLAGVALIGAGVPLPSATS